MDCPAFTEIRLEIERARKKFPRWPNCPIHAASVVVEEAGELAKEANQCVYEPAKGSRENLRAEAIQTAAMCVRFIQSLDAKEYEFFHSNWHDQSAQV